MSQLNRSGDLKTSFFLRMPGLASAMRSLRGDRASPGYRIGGPQPRAALCLSTVLPFIADIVHF